MKIAKKMLVSMCLAMSVTMIASMPAMAASKKKIIIKTNKIKTTMTVGQKQTIKPKVGNKKMASKFTFKSSNKGVLTVNNKGVVVAKKAGSAKVTVTATPKTKQAKKLYKKTTKTFKITVKAKTKKTDNKKKIDNKKKDNKNDSKKTTETNPLLGKDGFVKNNLDIFNVSRNDQMIFAPGETLTIRLTTTDPNFSIRNPNIIVRNGTPPDISGPYYTLNKIDNKTIQLTFTKQAYIQLLLYYDYNSGSKTTFGSTIGPNLYITKNKTYGLPFESFLFENAEQVDFSNFKGSILFLVGLTLPRCSL